MKTHNGFYLAAVLCCAASVAARADFAIDVDMSADPIKDVRTSTCGPEVGYAGCLMQYKGWYGTDVGEEYWFRDHAAETSRAMREAGAWFQRMWDANAWFARRVPDTKPDPKKRYTQSHPDIAFKFWKDNGFKVLFTLEAWGGERSKKEIIELVDYIVANHYEDVIAGFELGNESYYDKNYASLAPVWCEIIPEIKKRMPKVKLGINLAELFELNPDITQVRNRMLAAGEIKRDTYFAAADFNRYSAQFVTAMSNCIDQITHVIYHAYGAETPYSCSYYGFQRFRNFVQAFPELKGKKMWLSEVRPRSDEDNYCQRMFREALIMAHYSMMAICQPEMDGFNHHQIYALSGGIYQSDGKTWQVQWRDAGREYNDWRAPMGQPRLEVGACGVMYRILAEAIKEHPLILRHGTSKEADTEDAFFTSARVTDQIYARRRALKEGKSGWSVPKVEGEVEWVALADEHRNELCLLMVNTKSEPVKVKLTARGKVKNEVKAKEFAAPTYRTLSCPEKFLDCRAVPGEGHPWTQLSWEDTQAGYAAIPMAAYEGMKPAASALTVEIAPHTVQSVTVLLRNAPENR